MSSFSDRPQIAQLHFNIWMPPNVAVAEVDGDQAIGARTVAIKNFSGSVSEVLPGMSVWADPPGILLGRTKLKVRVKTMTTSSMTVAENAIQWYNNQQIVVNKFVEPWSIKPRILTVNNTPTFYKDYDIAYTNQNLYMAPVVSMGPDYAGPIGTDVYFTSANTFDPNGDSMTYAWVFEGGTPSTSVSTEPGFVHYAAAGCYIAKLTVTNSHGASTVGYRHIAIGQESVAGMYNWGVDSWTDDYKQHGTVVNAWSTHDFSTYLKGGALVVLTADEWWHGTRNNIGSNAHRQSTVFTGYIQGGRKVKWNPETKRFDFTIAGLGVYADALDVYGISLQFRESTANWTWWKMWRLTADKAVIHYLRWHTNLLSLADFTQTGDGKFTKYADIARGKPFSSAGAFLNAALNAEIGTDPTGRIFCTFNPELQPTIDRTNLVWASIDKTLWRTEPQVTDNDVPPVSHVEVGGIVYTGATGTSTAYLSGASMEAADDFGSPQAFEGLIVDPAGQTWLNAISGHVYEAVNNPLRDVALPLAFNARSLSTYPRKWLIVNTRTADGDAYQWVDKRFLIDRLSHKYDALEGTIVSDATIRAETIGVPGVTITIPIPDPVEPPVEPPIIEPPITQPPPLTGNAREKWFAPGNYVVWSGDYATGLLNQPGWNLATGLPSFSVLTWFGITSTGVGYICVDAGSGSDKIYKSTTPKTGPWTAIMNYGDSLGGGRTAKSFGLFQVTGENISTRFLAIENNHGYRGVYNGTSWTFADVSSFAIEPGAVLPTGYVAETVADTTAYLRNNSFGVVSSWSKDFGAENQASAWQNNISGNRYFIASQSTIVKLINGETGAVAYNTAEADGAHTESIYIRGAIRGPSVYFVTYASGKLYASTDGVTFTQPFSWGTNVGGIVLDMLDIGGGSLTWNQLSFGANQEFDRVSADGGLTWVAKTGNFWILVPATSYVLHGCGLVYA